MNAPAVAGAQPAGAQPQAKPLLRVSALAKRYGAREALRAVDFDVQPGELVALVGPNGAGKTTLLSILAGVQRPTGGTLTMSSPPAGARAIGWAPQQPALYSRLSVAENLRLFARLQKVSDADSAVRRMLDQTGLRPRAHELVGRLSGGNRQRVNVALALIARPQLLLLDEPSSALDPGQRERLWAFIDALVDPASADCATSVLFSTHHLGEAHRYATRALVLADGELLFDGAPDELLAGDDDDGGERGGDLEHAFVAFLSRRGHA